MSWQHQYVSEKLRELDKDKRERFYREPKQKPKPIVGPVARRAGKALRRFGEGLEAWGSPATG
jgi:hypothetical protein